MEDTVLQLKRKECRWVQRPGLGRGGSVFYDRFYGHLYRDRPTEIAPDDLIYSSPDFVPNSPFKVYFDLTNRCNLECKHCITSSSPTIDITGELATDRILSLINEFDEIGVLEMASGGGEPFVHKNWYEIFSAVTASGINLILTTNGLLLNPKTLEKLQDIAPLEVRISFDGGPQLHEYIRGPKTYAKALKGLGALAEKGFNVTSRLTLCEGAENEMDQLFFDLASTGVPRVKVALIKETGRAATETGHNLLIKGDVVEAQMELLVTLGQVYGLHLQFSADDFPLTPHDANDPKLRDVARPNCGAGFETCYISPRGELLGCVAIPNIQFGVLHEASFTDAWQNKVSADYREKAMESGQRRICDALCGSQKLKQHNGQSIIPIESIL